MLPAKQVFPSKGLFPLPPNSYTFYGLAARSACYVSSRANDLEVTCSPMKIKLKKVREIIGACQVLNSFFGGARKQRRLVAFALRNMI